jgi:hypothetical protein
VPNRSAVERLEGAGTIVRIERSSTGRLWATLTIVLIAVSVAGCSSATPSTTTTVRQDIATTSETTTALPDGTQITVSLEGLEGYVGLAVQASVLPLVASEPVILGEAHFEHVVDDPFTDSAVLRSQESDAFGNFAGYDTAVFLPGEYRFVIEAWVPSGPMRYGCERQIVTQADRSTDVIVLTSIPEYTGDGLHWTPYTELAYPHCPMWP